MKNTVCKECSKRHIGCHSTCQEYIDECKKIMAEKERILERKKKDFIINDYKVASHMKTKRVQKGKKR